METSLYSVRMRASRSGQHLSGAERIVAGTAISAATAALTERAMGCCDVGPDEIHCRVERLDSTSVRYAQLPDVSTYLVDDWRQGHQVASVLLNRAGVHSEIAEKALQLLADGAGPGGAAMRGAIIMDSSTGERLEADQSRGVRVSRMDLTPECQSGLGPALESLNLGHHRVLEALVLAGKVLSAPGIVAELCWSDAPEYIAGYVAAPQVGYQRISALKSAGDSHGGRVFFVRRELLLLEELVDYLENQAVLFDSSGNISAPGKWVTADE
jgi:6-carboxyhexanoate--CoA ligase